MKSSLTDQYLTITALVRVLLLGACLLLLACSKKSVKESSFDASVAKQTKAGGISGLAGQWAGSAMVPQFGVVIGSLRLQANGKGHYYLSAKGIKREGAFEVLAWDGKVIKLQAEGRQRDLKATLKEPELVIEIPELGESLTLRR